MRVRRTLSALLLTAGLIASSAPALALEEGQPAPDFTLPDIQEGKPAITLSDLRGKTVYVDFWASWCAPCKQSFVWMQGLQARYRPQELTVLAINLDKHRADADRFLQKNPVTFTLAFDPQGESARQFDVKTMPSAYLLSPEGKVLMVHRGFVPQDVGVLQQRIEQALGGNR